MSPTAQQAMAALEQAWLSWHGPLGADEDCLSPVEIALRDVLEAWSKGGRR